jgi:hypothetical protein
MAITHIRVAFVMFMLTGLSQIGLAQKQIPKQPAATDSTRPVGLVGQDIETEVRRLIAAPPRSEFETTQQYEARRPAPSAKEFAFSLPTGKNDGDVVSFAYSADDQAMTLDVWGVDSATAVYGRAAGKESLLVKRHLVNKRQYIGSNAFGVKTLITSETNNQFYIVMVTGDAMDAVSGKYSWRMTTAEAKASKLLLRLLVLCKETEAPVYKEDDYGRPTTDYPFEHIWHNYYLPVSLTNVVVVDSRSGRIVKILELGK